MLKKILTTPTEELGRWSRFLTFQIKLWLLHCPRLLKQNRSGTQAAALTYHTIFGIVPLAIVMLMVLQSFPAYEELGENVRNFIYEQANLSKIMYPVESKTGTEANAEPEGIKLTDKIDEITNQFIVKFNKDKGLIALFSGVIVFWAALGLLTTIERSFNNIWHVARGRSFVKRIINYWSLLTLGPLLLGIGIYVSTNYLAKGGLNHDGLIRYTRIVLPYLISVMALFFLYFMLPNTKVNAKSALWGAAVAALVWTGAKFLFRIYVTKLMPYQYVYGIMGLVPMGVFWIFVTWLIVIFGLQLTYATQNLKSLDEAELAKMKGKDEYFIANNTTIIKMLSIIEKAFEDKTAGPVPVETISSQLNVPPEFAEKILDHLVNTGLLFKTNQPQTGYSPATEGDNITLADIAEGISKACFAQGDEDMSEKLKEAVRRQKELMTGYTLKELTRKKSPS